MINKKYNLILIIIQINSIYLKFKEERDLDYKMRMIIKIRFKMTNRIEIKKKRI